MKRRFNYTERKRITQNRLSVRIVRDNGQKATFDASVDLKDMELPDEASVYLEAYHQHELARYKYGEVKAPAPEGDNDLSALARYENLLFRILIVDESGKNGLLLASAEKIQPVDAERGKLYRKSILPVDFQDLGRQVWTLAYDDDSPVLRVNINIPNIKSVAKTDPRFFIHIYPAVVREILTHMIFIDGVDDPEEPELDWHKDWLCFAKQVNPNINPPGTFNRSQQGFDSAEVAGWIDQVVNEFCASRGGEWRKYIGLEEGI